MNMCFLGGGGGGEGGYNYDSQVQVGLTLVTYFSIGMVIFISSTWSRNRESQHAHLWNGNGTNVFAHCLLWS